MATHTFDRGGSDDGTLDVSLFTYYGEERVWTDIEPGVSSFGLTADQARAYAADLITHADALDERNTHPPVISYGLTAKQHAALEETARAAAANPPPRPRPRYTVVVAEYHQHINYWCHQNRRNPHDRTIIRIVNGLHDATHNLMGLTDFELVVLSPCRHYDEVMALIRQRQLMPQDFGRPGEALATQRAISPVGPRHSSYGSSDPGRPSSPSALPQNTPATTEPPESEPA